MRTGVPHESLSRTTLGNLCDREAAGLFHELSTLAFSNNPERERFPEILQRLHDLHFPAEQAKCCILSRISFHAACNRAFCVETNQLFTGWSHTLHLYNTDKYLTISDEDIRQAIATGISTRCATIEKIRKEGKFLSEERIRETLSEKLFAHFCKENEY
ncbi:MAG: hypothetical protein AAB445_03910 [Patescibacteria group bacterium]